MKNNGTEEEFEDFDMEEVEMNDDLYTELDDERRDELDELIGLKVLGIELWEESLGDEEDAEPIKPEERNFFDCDLFLADNMALELYVASVYPDPDSDEPVTGMDKIYNIVGRLSDEGMKLLDYDQADDEGGLYVAFGRKNDAELVVVASVWMVSEWEEEAEDEDEA